jgi:hypothetical protein
MIFVVLAGLILTGAVSLGVWSATGDPWTTAEAASGTGAVMVGFAIAAVGLQRFHEPLPTAPDDPISPRPPSASWLVPGLSGGDGSERHLRTRTLPALRELAARLLAHEHALDLDAPGHRPAIEALLTPRLVALLQRDGADVLAHGRRAAFDDIKAITEGLARL